MLVAFVAILVVGAVMTLISFTVHTATSARSMLAVVARARAELLPAATELATAAKEVAQRLRRLRPQP